MTLHQRKYVREVIKRFNMLESKPAASPIEKNLKLEKAGYGDKMNATLFT